MGGDDKANFLPEEMGISACLADKWKSRKIENCGKLEKWKDIRGFNFSHFCLVESGKVEGWKMWVCINLLVHHC